MMHKMKQVGMDQDPSALWLAAMISSFALETEQNTQWLKERYPPMLDFLEESPLYQEIIEKGQEQGLLRFVELRFPSLLVQAKQVIEHRMSLRQFQVLQDKIYSAATIEEAAAALQSA